MNSVMMPKSIRFDATLVTVPIVLLSICPNPHIVRPTNATSPPMVISSTGCSRLMRCQSEVMMIPAMVATLVANRMGMKTSVGVCAPLAARKARIVVGMMVSPEVLSTKNMIIGLVAVSFLTLSSCICAMARSPVGVAALSSPNMFEAMFMKMLPNTGWPLGMSGKSLEKTGLNPRAKTLTTPAFSPIFMMPSQSDSTPVSPNDTSKAFFEESKVLSTMC